MLSPEIVPVGWDRELEFFSRSRKPGREKDGKTRRSENGKCVGTVPDRNDPQKSGGVPEW
ncbi:hypothetical protein [Nocardia cyriacigeorgica]|uniref:hypothetical protein n=1 Tax=Nocardia cyriacigeorgica TaxID=135487 RepID=UPI002458BDE4|nr:hypothetical protein [Nocardia cyriacigeorgica]